MIDRLILKNFKVLRDVDVCLRPLTLIVGPNASGKSSVLQALGVLAKVAFRPSEAPLPFSVRSRISAEPPVVGCHFNKEAVTVRIRPDPTFWTIEVLPDGINEDDGFDDSAVPYAVDLFGSVIELNLEIEKLETPAYPKQILTALPPDGDGLPAFLATLQIERPATFQSLVERLRSVIPVVRNLRLKTTYIGEPNHSDRKVGYELLFDMHGAEGVPAHSISEGTLLTLGLLTALSSPEPPRLLLIDELERGLHPKALGDLVKQIRAVQDRDPGLQIVAASHSPYLLDYLEAEEILLTSLDEDGYASIRPLSDHPDYERWKDVMAPGEFWSTVGEQWVTEKTAS